MTATAGRPDTPPPLLTGWQVVALAGLFLACVVGGLLLLPEEARLTVMHDAGGVVAPYVAPVLAAIAAAIAARAAQAARHETAKQTPLLETAVAQTNGALTRRDDRIRELEAQLEAGHARERSATPAGATSAPAGEGPSTATLPTTFGHGSTPPPSQ